MPRSRWPAAALVACYCAGASPVAAQLCEDDGGLWCDDDAGATGDDAGVIPGPARGDAGAPDGGYTAGPACSCTTDEVSSQGRIHVCTGSDERAICLGFSCDRGTVRGRACERSDARMCCQMRSRGLYSQLYEDCDHPNCQAGFVAQCSDFGGVVTRGACTQAREPSDDDGGGGLCSVARVAHGSGGPSLGALLAGLSLLGLRRRPRRRV